MASTPPQTSMRASDCRGCAGVLCAWASTGSLAAGLARTCMIVDLVGGSLILATRADSRFAVVAAMMLFLLALVRATCKRPDEPITVLLNASYLIYLDIPLVWIGLDANALRIDETLGSRIPSATEESSPVAVLLLAACVIAAEIAIRTGPRASTCDWRFTRSGVRRVVAVGCIMLAVTTIYDRILADRWDGLGQWARLCAEILKHVSHEWVLALVLFCMLASPTLPPHASARSRRLLWLICLLPFIVLSIINASKAALLSIAAASVVFPVALARMTGRKWIIIPGPIPIACAIALLLPLFALGNAIRDTRRYEPQSSELRTLLVAATRVMDTSPWGEESVLITFATRMSTPLLRHFSICHRFIEPQAGDTDLRIGYLSYSVKSFCNLALPTTPFPEAYAPSSALLEPMLADGTLDPRGIDRESYRATLNSQPTTFPGWCFIAAGWLAPLVVFMSVRVMLQLANTSWLPASFTALYAVYLSVPCYGIEAVGHVATSAALTFGILWWALGKQPRARRTI